jgi:predicted nucleic acid-binding protein
MAESQEDRIVVDASLVFRWFVAEDDSDRAVALLQRWAGNRTRITAPHFLVAEVANALHQRVRQGHMTVEEAEARMEEVLSPRLGIDFYDASNLHPRAVQLANQLRQPAVYDSIYLALAEALGGELWTADRNFHRAASVEFGNVRWLREADVRN